MNAALQARFMGNRAERQPNAVPFLTATEMPSSCVPKVSFETHRRDACTTTYAKMVCQRDFQLTAFAAMSLPFPKA